MSVKLLHLSTYLSILGNIRRPDPAKNIHAVRRRYDIYNNAEVFSNNESSNKDSKYIEFIPYYKLSQKNTELYSSSGSNIDKITQDSNYIPNVRSLDDAYVYSSTSSTSSINYPVNLQKDATIYSSSITSSGNTLEGVITNSSLDSTSCNDNNRSSCMDNDNNKSSCIDIGNSNDISRYLGVDNDNNKSTTSSANTLEGVIMNCSLDSTSCNDSNRGSCIENDNNICCCIKGDDTGSHCTGNDSNRSCSISSLSSTRRSLVFNAMSSSSFSNTNPSYSCTEGEYEVKPGLSRDTSVDKSCSSLDKRAVYSITTRNLCKTRAKLKELQDTDASLETLPTTTDASLETLYSDANASLETLRTDADDSLETLCTTTDASLETLRTNTDTSLETLHTEMGKQQPSTQQNNLDDGKGLTQQHFRRQQQRLQDSTSEHVEQKSNKPRQDKGNSKNVETLNTGATSNEGMNQSIKRKQQKMNDNSKKTKQNPSTYQQEREVSDGTAKKQSLRYPKGTKKETGESIIKQQQTNGAIDHLIWNGKAFEPSRPSSLPIREVRISVMVSQQQKFLHASQLGSIDTIHDAYVMVYTDTCAQVM